LDGNAALNFIQKAEPEGGVWITDKGLKWAAGAEALLLLWMN
jgi:hypothetical protein